MQGNDKSIAQSGHKRLPLLPAGCTAAAVLVLLIAVYMLAKPVPITGSKNISVDVVYQNGITDHYQIATEAQFLLEALRSIPDFQIDGTTTVEFGLMVTTINGRRAEYQKDGAYWALYCDGEPCNYGVSKQTISDEENYAFKYTLTNEGN